MPLTTHPPTPSDSNSYQFATGSSENVVKIWDMRRRANIYTIPAHSALVAAVKYVEGRELNQGRGGHGGRL